MSLDEKENIANPIQPRFFWRRILAFLVDFALVAILFTLMMKLVQPFVSVPLIAPSAINFRTCKDITEIQRSLPVLQTMKLQSDEKPLVVRCDISNMGLLKFAVLSVSATKTQGAVTASRSISYYVNDRNEFIRAFDTSPFFWLSIPAVFAAIRYVFGQTPGKKLVSLQISTVDGIAATLGRLTKREYLRLAIFVAYGVISILGLVFWNQAGSPEELVKSLGSLQATPSWWFAAVILPVLFLLPYLFSLVRWQGQMFYDKITGFVVTKTGT